MTNDFVQDYYTYSGTNLVKAWGTNLIPPIGSAIGGAYGTAEGFKLGYPYGPIATAVSSYSLGTLGSISGGIAGDIKKWSYDKIFRQMKRLENEVKIINEISILFCYYILVFSICL